MKGVPWLRPFVVGTLLALSGGLLILGAGRKHKVYEPKVDAFGDRPFRRISEIQMVVDATFGGATRREGHLISTYDRSQQGAGKRACPT